MVGITCIGYTTNQTFMTTKQLNSSELQSSQLHIVASQAIAGQRRVNCLPILTNYNGGNKHAESTTCRACYQNVENVILCIVRQQMKKRVQPPQNWVALTVNNCLLVLNSDLASRCFQIRPFQL